MKPAGSDELIEINTDLWDTQDKPYDENGDTPFMVKRPADEKTMSQEELEQTRSDEIMDIYNKKYGQKSFFDEIWEREHPEEAKA